MKTVKDKLGMREGENICVLNSPDQYLEVTSNASVAEAKIIQLFVVSQSEIEKFIDSYQCYRKIFPVLWITYPKTSPYLGIHRDSIAAYLLEKRWKAVSICSIDSGWSAIRFKKI